MLEEYQKNEMKESGNQTIFLCNEMDELARQGVKVAISQHHD